MGVAVSGAWLLVGGWLLVRCGCKWGVAVSGGWLCHRTVGRRDRVQNHHLPVRNKGNFVNFA